MRTKLSQLWGRISGADKGKQYPEQQGVSLSRVGDYTIVWPYGHYADAPNNQLFIEIAEGVAMPVTVQRPDDIEQDEVVLFHPATNSRIIARNNNDLDILVDDGPGNLNIKCQDVNVEASGDANIEADGDVNVTADTVNIDASTTNIGVGGQPIARLGDSVEVTGVAGGASTRTGTITSAGSNTST